MPFLRLAALAGIFFFLTAGALVLSAASPASSALVGAWHIDDTRSTELSPWKSFDLVIALKGRLSQSNANSPGAGGNLSTGSCSTPRKLKTSA